MSLVGIKELGLGFSIKERGRNTLYCMGINKNPLCSEAHGCTSDTENNIMKNKDVPVSKKTVKLSCFNFTSRVLRVWHIDFFPYTI